MDESTTIFYENNYNFLYKSGLRLLLLDSLDGQLKRICQTDF